MDRLPPLKPKAPAPAADTRARAGHGTAKAASRSGPMHPHALVVSLHDVRPATRDICDTMLRDLETLGVTGCSLLVVPDHHGSGHFLQDPAFCDWLVQRAQAGHEIVIHGYYHQRPRKEDDSLADRVTTQIYTADEGEFYDLDHATALHLVGRARDEFSQLGISPDGFVAPAWLLSDAGESALRESGCEYTTRLREVIDLRTGHRTKSQSLVWSVRSGWRRAMSLVWNATLFRMLGANPLLRISIHPVDLQHPAVWAQIRKLTALALRDRAPFTYERWVTRERTFRVISR
jgi:predicted deacetylase